MSGEYTWKENRPSCSISLTVGMERYEWACRKGSKEVGSQAAASSLSVLGGLHKLKITYLGDSTCV